MGGGWLMVDPGTLANQTPQFLAGAVFGGLTLGGIACGVVYKIMRPVKANGNAPKLKPHYHPELVSTGNCLKNHQDLKELLDAKLEAGNERMKGIEAVGKANNRYLEELSKRRRSDRGKPQ
jgi:hypothetical protein